MSELSEQIRIALYDKLNVSGVTSLATGGVWNGEAGETSNAPYLIFEEVSKFPVYAFGMSEVCQDALWSVKAWTETGSGDSALGLGKDILEAAKTAIGDALSLTAGTTWAVYWDRDLPAIRQPVAGRNVWMTGFLLRVVAESGDSTVSYVLWGNNDDMYWGTGETLRWE